MSLDVVFIKILDEIITNVVPNRCFDKAQIFFKIFITERNTQEPSEPTNNIIFKPFRVLNGDDVIFIRLKRRLWNLRQIVHKCFTLVGQHKTRLVEAIAPKHAPNGIRQEFCHRV